MIYTASLNIPVKNALKRQVQQSNLQKICQQLPLNPDITNMDVVILGPKDCIGPRREQLQNAINKRHADICVIYIYEKDADADNIDCDYKKQCKKIKPPVIVDAFEEFVGEHKVRQGKQRVSSADFVAPISDSIGNVKKEEQEDINVTYKPFEFNLDTQEPVEEPEPEPQIEAPSIEDAIEKLEEPVVPVEDILSKPLDTAFSIEQPLEAKDEELPPPVKPVTTVEDSLAAMNTFDDWSILKEHLNKNTVVKKLIEENTEYVGLINMLEVLDKEIQTIWRDPALSPDQKFEKIKSIGLQRSVVRASTNSINVEKVISIISTIILSAKRTVDEKISGIDTALYKITTDKKSIMDTSYIDRAIEERAKVQRELLCISRGIVDLYRSIDNLVTEEIMELDRHLPSSNEFINNMVKPLGTQIFTPQNTAELVNKLHRALQNNRLVASQLEESVNAVIQSLFELCEKDEEIIRYQANMLNLLKANRVEDVIIANSLLKKTMRIFVGADNSGRSSTAITWCGILSRRNNSLLIDLTGRAKFREYGISPISLDEFLNNRVEQQFLCVESDRKLTPEELQNFTEQIKGRLNYYPYVNVILAPEDTEGINQLSEDALCIHYITDCTTSSIKIMHDVVERHKTENIARKLVVIDAPVSPLMISNSVGVDPTICKLVPLPNVPALRACSIKHDRPYEYNDVVGIYEEAFR